MFAQAPVFLSVLQAAADSTATRLVVERSWLDTAVNLAQSLTSLLLLAMLVLGVLLLYTLRKSIEQLTKMVNSAQEPLRQAITEARSVTGEVRAIALSLQAPIALAGQTLADASSRVQQVMERAEGRLERFDALVDIAQEEAEEAVVSAASLLHGVRAGGDVVRQTLGLARGARRKRRRPRSNSHRNGSRGVRSRGAAGRAELDSADAEGPSIRPRPTSPR